MAGALNLGEQGEMTVASCDMHCGFHLPPRTTH
jgi:hypothetical protein